MVSGGIKGQHWEEMGLLDKDLLKHVIPVATIYPCCTFDKFSSIFINSILENIGTKVENSLNITCSKEYYLFLFSFSFSFNPILKILTIF